MWAAQTPHLHSLTPRLFRRQREWWSDSVTSGWNYNLSTPSLFFSFSSLFQESPPVNLAGGDCLYHTHTHPPPHTHPFLQVGYIPPAGLIHSQIHTEEDVAKGTFVNNLSRSFMVSCKSIITPSTFLHLVRLQTQSSVFIFLRDLLP